MDEPERLLFVPGNIGKQSKGVAFGLQGNLAFPVLGGVMLGIGIFIVALNEADWPFGVTVLVSALPALLTFGFVWFFFQGKPPHYLGDKVSGILTDPVVRRSPGQPEHPRLTALKIARRRRAD